MDRNKPRPQCNKCEVFLQESGTLLGSCTEYVRRHALAVCCDKFKEKTETAKASTSEPPKPNIVTANDLLLNILNDGKWIDNGESVGCANYVWAIDSSLRNAIKKFLQK